MTMGPGQDYAATLLARSDEALESALVLLEKCLFADSISRAYYSMYNAAQSILYLHGLSAKTHSGTINVFGKEIVEKGIVPRKLGKIINDTHDLRQNADYSPGADFELADAEQAVEDARYFLAQIRLAISQKDR